MYELELVLLPNRKIKALDKNTVYNIHDIKNRETAFARIVRKKQ